MSKDKSCKVTIVPETHWDRAWYLPFEQFRIRLVRLVDRLLDGLREDRAFTCFTLDGQTVVLEDYLQIRPEKRSEIEKMVRAKRLHIGPWYILPDEFIVSGESLVRNLLIGKRISEQFGRRMSVGYVPDPFGHIGQLPQILQGFGLDSFVFSRGMWDRDRCGLEFTWNAPDGSSVLALYQRFFYNNAAFLGYPMEWGDPENLRFDMALALNQIREAVEKLLERTRGASVLLNNGVDHSEHQPELPRIISEAQGRMRGWDVRIGGFEDYVANIRQDLRNKRLPVHNGELTYRYGDLLTGVYSSRIYLKQANHRCETLLERYAEPLEAAAAWGGKPEPVRALLEYAWRELLKNQPHDDICGCSLDSVHRENVIRFERIEQVAADLCTLNLRHIAHRMDHGLEEGVPHVVFNPTGFPRNGVHRFKIYLDPSEKELLNGFHLADFEGKSIAFAIQNERIESWMECCKPFKMRGYEIVADLRNLPALGFTTVFVRPKPARLRKPNDPIHATANSVENRQLKVTVAADGSLNLYNKKTRKVYRNLMVFEDREDTGDEYNWSHIENAQILVSSGSKAKISLIESSPLSATLRIEQRLRIPASLNQHRTGRSRNTVMLPIQTDVTLQSGARAVRIRSRVENRAQDHRLRVLFPTGIQTQRVSVDEHFDVVSRTVIPPQEIVLDGRTYPPYPTEHQKAFVDISNGKHGLAILNVGLPEYESIPGRDGVTIALTLFRSVGWLSRADFLTRPGDVGPANTPTPDAQCQGVLTFEYGLCPHAGDWIEGDLLRESREIHQPILVTRADLHGGTQIEQEGWNVPVPREGTLPAQVEILRLEPSCLVLSAFKSAENGKGWICRFYNPTDETVNAAIRFGFRVKKIHEVDLQEEPFKARGKVGKDSVYRMRVPAKRIVSLRVE